MIFVQNVHFVVDIWQLPPLISFGVQRPKNQVSVQYIYIFYCASCKKRNNIIVVKKNEAERPLLEEID
jgi:hypothetical protein